MHLGKLKSQGRLINKAVFLQATIFTDMSQYMNIG